MEIENCEPKRKKKTKQDNVKPEEKVVSASKDGIESLMALTIFFAAISVTAILFLELFNQR